MGWAEGPVGKPVQRSVGAGDGERSGGGERYRRVPHPPLVPPRPGDRERSGLNPGAGDWAGLEDGVAPAGRCDPPADWLADWVAGRVGRPGPTVE